MRNKLFNVLKKIISSFNPIQWIKNFIKFIKDLPRILKDFRHFSLELISFIFLFFVYLFNIALTGILKLSFVPQFIRNILLKTIYKLSILVSKFDKKGGAVMNRLELFELAFKNMRFKKSRTLITVGGMAVGIGAIVFLVSLGYGLQKLVIDRVARLDEMRQTDVSVQPGSNVRMDERSLASFKEIDKVKEVLPIIGVVAKVNFQGSVTDVAVYGTTTSYLENSAIRTVEGKLFESNDFKKAVGLNFLDNKLSHLSGFIKENSYDEYIEYIDEDKNIVDVQAGEVAGASTEKNDKLEVKFLIFPKSWLTVRESPEKNSKIIGYTRKVEGIQYGEEVWGDPYIPARSDRIKIDSAGKAYGKWIKSSFMLWDLEKCTLDNINCEEGKYLKKLNESDEENNAFPIRQVQKIGYISEIDVAVEPLSEYVVSQNGNVLGISDSTNEQDSTSENTHIANYIDTLNQIENQGDVLALEDLATSSETTTNSPTDISSQDDLDWLDLVLETSSSEAKGEAKKVTLPQDAYKKAVVNEAFLKVLGLERKDAIGKSFDAYFVVTSDLLDNGEEKVESGVGTYEIIGVIQGDNSPFFYIPIYDLYGMGVKYFSRTRIVVEKSEDLTLVREKIESQGFGTTSVVDTVAQINKLFATARFVLALIGAVALAVASLGMFNTLTVSLLERTREVGLMKAMGMSSDEVRRLFLTESMMMGFTGGVAGIMLGFLAGKSISVILSIMGLVKKVGIIDIAYLPIGFVGLIFILSLIVGIFTGVYPAKRATKISSLNALRYE